MIWLGLAFALIMGITLGVMGSGGAIITVPILVYLFKIPAIDATGHSLLIVGVTSFCGAYFYWRRREIDSHLLIKFAAPSVVGAFLSRRYLIPALPEVFFLNSSLAMTNHTFVLLTFALVMFLSAGSMIRPKSKGSAAASFPLGVGSHLSLGLLGLGVGAISGFVGVGGGFLIIPVLYHFAKLPVKRAAGTSLAIIAAQSVVGFIATFGQTTKMRWPLLIGFMALAILGITVGSRWNAKISSEKLKMLFGWFVLAVAVAILGAELWPR